MIMKINNISLKLLPLLGLFLIIAGYIYLTISNIKLNNEISTKKAILNNLNLEIKLKKKELTLRNDEIENTREIIEKRAPQLVPKLDSITETYQIKTYALANNNSNYFKVTPISKRDSGLALIWENKGYYFLLSKDINSAINAFRNSENSYNGFRYVYEITNLLNKNRYTLKDTTSEDWNLIYRTITTDLNMKMPADVKKKMLSKIK